MVPITPKERQRLADLLLQIASGTFSEDDVSSLLILLRDKARGKPIRELADGVAHNSRRSGEFFNRVKANADVMNAFGQKAGVLRGGDIFSSDDFATNLNETLQRHGFDALDRALCDLLLLCGLSLIQDAAIKGGSTSGEFSLTLTSERFELHTTVPVTPQGKDVKIVFPVASVPNRWIRICNPRAHIHSEGPVCISVVDHVPTVQGFKPFEVYIERSPAIASADVRLLLASDVRMMPASDGLTYVSPDGGLMPLRYDSGRLIVPGRPEFFRMGSDYERVLKNAMRTLSACVHDDAGAHWFLEGLGLPPDGFHCHWVGRGSPTCTRPQ
jgi:hypothetical protein